MGEFSKDNLGRTLPVFLTQRPCGGNAPQHSIKGGHRSLPRGSSGLPDGWSSPIRCRTARSVRTCNVATGFSAYPTDQLHEVISKGDACISIEDARAWVGCEVRRHDLIFSVAQNALQFAFGSLKWGRSFTDHRQLAHRAYGFHSSFDLVVSRRVRQAHCEVHHTHIHRRNAECHAGQLAVELGEDFADSSSGAGGSWDDVAEGSSAHPPVLSSFGWSINRQLVGSCRVHCGHKTLRDAEAVVDDLRQRCQAVGSARSIRQDPHIAAVLVLKSDVI